MKALKIRFCYAVGQIKLLTDGFALPNGIALSRPFFSDLFHHIRRLIAKAPVRVAKIKERRAVVEGKVFFAGGSRDKAVLIDVERTAVGGAVDFAGSAVQLGIFDVGADGFELPRSLCRANEAGFPNIAAVPIARNRIQSAVAKQQKIERHIAERISIGSFTFKREFHRAPGLSSKRLPRRAFKQRVGIFLPACRSGRSGRNIGFIRMILFVFDACQNAVKRCFDARKPVLKAGKAGRRIRCGKSRHCGSRKQHRGEHDTEHSFHSHVSPFINTSRTASK